MSDDEFVEKVRRDLSRNKKIYIWLSIFLVAAIFISLWVIQYIISSTRFIGHGQGDVDLGLILGFTTGISLSFMLIPLFYHASQAISLAIGKGYVTRLMKLTVKFYDQRQLEYK